MSILINKNTKVIVQGITGNQGSFHTKLMKQYGTNIVAGVTPGKKGQKIQGIPVYNTIKDALKKHKADYSIAFVPAKFIKKAAYEALQNNLNLILITEGIPVHDTIEIVNAFKKKNKILIGPNCPGLITPEESKIGIIPGYATKKGNIGIVSRSGTLTYEIANELTKNNIGQSTIIGIGGDPIVGLDMIETLKLFEKDKQTKKIILVGEIGGDIEERAAEYIKKNISKEVIAFIAGKTAPKGKRMGHAGAIIEGETGTFEAKIKALKKANIKIAETLSEIVKFLL